MMIVRAARPISQRRLCNDISRSCVHHRSYSVHLQSKSSDSKRLAISIASLVISGAALYAFSKYEKHRAEASLKAKKDESIGKPLVGGPFSLVDLSGKPVTDMDYQGKFMLLYFGYTFCPDVCPEELEKMAIVIDAIDGMSAEFGKNPLTPIFVSCDPKRDSIKSLKEYLKEYHKKFIGLTGTHGQIKRVARSYRMYYSAPPRALDDADADYLVDHSIFFYLVGPSGEYITHFGRIDDAATVTEKIVQVMRDQKFKSTEQ